VEGQSRIPKIDCPNTCQADINRHGLHVQAVACDSMSMRTQELVAPSSAVPTDYVDFGVRPAYLNGEIMQKIKNPRIVMAYVAGTMVAQVAIKVSQCFGNVLVVSAIDDIQALSRVHVKELQPILGIARG
jgi:hypothetical protein